MIRRAVISSIDCFPHIAGELHVAPVPTHFSVEKLLIDGRKFCLEHFLQKCKDFGVPFP